MILIIGGAYQGKREYAKTAFSLREEDICTGEKPDFSFRCVDRLEEFTLACVKAGADPVEYFRETKAQWADKILICQDMSSGVVPMGAEIRVWRQENGRLCRYLAAEAQQVYRIFCGLEQRLK